MTTVTINISLTGGLKVSVDERIKARGYSWTSEYMRDLLRRDEERAKEERFKAHIQAGLDSGPGRPWTEHKAELRARIDSARQAATRQTP